MDCLQSLLESSSTPVLTAFILGLLTALSPCPLATNIAAIGYIGKNINNRKRIFCNGLLYTLGRVVVYTLLGVVLIALLKGGSSLFGIQKFIGKYGELILPPALLLIGLYMLFETNYDYLHSDLVATESVWQEAEVGVRCSWECCLLWHFAPQAESSISGC